jgi:hypothetical protein
MPPITKTILQYSSFRLMLKKEFFFPAPEIEQIFLNDKDTPKLLPIQVSRINTNAIMAPEKAQCQG